MGRRQHFLLIGHAPVPHHDVGGQGSEIGHHQQRVAQREQGQRDRQQQGDQEPEHDERIPDLRRHADVVADLERVAIDPVGRPDPEEHEQPAGHQLVPGQVVTRSAIGQLAGRIVGPFLGRHHSRQDEHQSHTAE